MLGEIFPREVGAAFDDVKVPAICDNPDPTSTVDDPKVSELDEDPESVACLAFNSEEVAETVADVTVAEVFKDMLDIAVEEAAAFGIEVGMATGQNDQTFLPWSQYRSNSNLRKPTASRLERQSPELSSSYLKPGKQAACKETPGDVT